MYGLPVNCPVSDCGLWLSSRSQNLMENEVLILFAIKVYWIGEIVHVSDR